MSQSHDRDHQSNESNVKIQPVHRGLLEPPRLNPSRRAAARADIPLASAKRARFPSTSPYFALHSS